MALICSVCGAHEVVHQEVLWPELIAEWEIGAEEVAYINHQQGTHCARCGTQVRGLALADAIRAWMKDGRTLRAALADPRHRAMVVGDMNGCAGVSESFAALPAYRRLDFPDFDMRSLPFADGSFDLVFHSDTLEHVPDPLAALRECLRVLKPEGRLCFTAPVIVARLSRSRAGLPPSYHGAPGTKPEDYLVESEFGADLWCLLAQAGGRAIEIHTVDYPAGIAWSLAPPAPRSLAAAAPQGGVRNRIRRWMGR